MSIDIPLSEDHDLPVRFTTSCPPALAEKVRSVILERGLFDPDRSTGRDGMVFFPILIRSDADLHDLKSSLSTISERVKILEGEVSTGNRDPILKPRDRVIRNLDGVIPSDLLDLVPGAYERIGDSLVLKIDDRLEDHRMAIASAFAMEIGSRYVLQDRSGVRGEFRQPTMEVIIPPADGNFDVVHKEGDVRYKLDPRKVMFSSGNTDERSIFPDLVQRSGPPPRFACGRDDLEGQNIETVVDMFCGIGYFTIPLARKNRNGMRIIAVEKNPESFHYLRKNIIINGVEGVVEPVLGDNREAVRERVADRIIMGFVGGTIDFFPHALSISDPAGSLIHFHDTVEIENGISGLFNDLGSIASRHGWRLEIVSSHRVKSFAPRIDHVEIDLRVLPEKPSGPLGSDV